MAQRTLLGRGGLTYVDRRDFTRGDTLTALKRVRWPSARLWVEDSTLTFSSRGGSDTLQHAEVSVLPHRLFAVSFETEQRDQVLLFWTHRARAVVRELARLGWDAELP